MASDTVSFYQKLLDQLFGEQKEVLAVTPENQKPAVVQSYLTKINEVLGNLTLAKNVDTATTNLTTTETDTQKAIKDLESRIYGNVTSFTPAPKENASQSFSPWVVFAGVFGLLWISTILKKR